MARITEAEFAALKGREKGSAFGSAGGIYTSAERPPPTFKASSGESEYEDAFWYLCGGEEKGWRKQVQAVPGRKWKFDFGHGFKESGESILPSHPGWDTPLLVEVHGLFARGSKTPGLNYAPGRHIRPGGFTKDRHKMNAAQALGIIVLEFTPDDFKSPDTMMELVNKCLGR